MQEPSAFNRTVNSSSTYHPVSSYTQRHPVSTSPSLYDTSGNLGYGVGRLLREAFDRVYSSWNDWWYPAPSKEMVAQSRQAMVYRKGLDAAMWQLDIAVEDLRQNPRNQHSLKRFKEVVKASEKYFSPAPTEKLGRYQKRLLNELRAKIEGVKVKSLRKTLLTYLPSLPPEATPVIYRENEVVSDGNRKRVVVEAQQTAGFQSPFDLTTLDGTNGFVVNGVASYDELGSVSTAGDLNGDGKTDLVLGAALGSNDTGAAYVIFGQSGFPAIFDLTTLDGTNGFVVNGIAGSDFLGASVGTAGDLNGDGKTDLVLGAYGVSNYTYTGAAYVIFGQSGFPAIFDLTTLDGTNGFVVNGIASRGYLGISVSTADDLNGDGKTDLVLGAYRVSNNTGAAYVIFGQSGFPAVFDLTTLDGTNGFVVNGIASNNYLGWSVSTASDLNGDGKTDLVLGAYQVSSFAGAAYVIFGQSSFPAAFNLTTLDGTNGFVVNGIASSNALGYSVSMAGDLNGDGKTDLVLGAPGVSNNTGAAYVIFGQSGFPAVFDLTTLNGANGFVVNGIASNNYLGWSVSTAGDLNGDGKTDLVLGAPSSYVSSSAGAAYVIFGQSGFPAIFDLTTLDGTNGLVVNGIASGGYLGVSVSTAGDLNGDNQTDFVLGASGVSNYTGAAYVVFGQDTPSTPIPQPEFQPSLILRQQPVYELKALLNGDAGSVVSGVLPNDQLGSSVSTAGDINYDGKVDFVLGAPGTLNNTGAAYVLLGQTRFPFPFDVKTLNGANGFVATGISTGDQLGCSGSNGGDINGDQIADVVLGAPGVFGNNGSVYVLFGRSSFPPNISVGNLNNQGFWVNGKSSGEQLGWSVSSNGDIDGDHIADLVLGAPGASNQIGAPKTGAVYVVFGQSRFTTLTAPFDLNTLNVTNGFVIQGSLNGDQLGWSISSQGDINGDHLTDLMLGAPKVDTNRGAVYVLFGQTSFSALMTTPSFSVANLNSTNGLLIYGESSGDEFGWTMSSGDINGDGTADLVVGAPGVKGGAVYVLFGGRNIPFPFDLKTLNGTNGFVIYGKYSGDQLGSSITAVDDINGDGQADLVLGAPGTSNDTGTVYVVYGQSHFPTSFNLTTLDGINGFAVYGITSGDRLGSSVSTSKDPNGGTANLVLGTRNFLGNSGTVYFINTGFIVSAPIPRTPSVDVGTIVGSIGGVIGFCVLLGLGYQSYRRYFGAVSFDSVVSIPMSFIKSDRFSETNAELKEIATGEDSEVIYSDSSSGSSSEKHGPSQPKAVKIHTKKSWYFDPAIKTEREKMIADKIYSLVEATDEDKHKVIELYQHCPVTGYEIVSIQVIHNPDMNQAFALHMKKLQQRNNNPAFKAKWPMGQENSKEPLEPAGYTKWRHEVYEQFKTIAEPYQDSDYPAVNLVPMWHGTKKDVLDSIFRIGYANLATTDAGFFGKGLYGAYEAEYSHRVYAKEDDVLIVNWVACFSAYPVIDGDMEKFKGKGNYSNYDAHFIPVVPRDPDNPYEEVYYPTKPYDKSQYTELVVFESAACLPRYVVELQRTLEKPLPLNRSQYHHVDTFFQPLPEQPELKEVRQQMMADKIYRLVEATDKDKRKVMEFYQHHEVSGYAIASIEVIYNSDLNHKFALYIKELQQRDKNPAFVAKWLNGREKMSEPIEPPENTNWRGEIHRQFLALAKPHQDTRYPSVNLLPMWHGTKPQALDSIFRTGYDNLATTDAGFFGKGIYGAHEAEYSYRVYAKDGGALILNWVACFSAYPVIHGDMQKFEGKANYSNYDAHFVPVVPRDPNNPDEEVCYPTKPDDHHQYTELVVFQSAACLPRYLVQLQRTLEKPLPLNRSQYSGAFFQPMSEQPEEELSSSREENREPPLTLNE